MLCLIIASLTPLNSHSFGISDLTAFFWESSVLSGLLLIFPNCIINLVQWWNFSYICDWDSLVRQTGKINYKIVFL